MSAKAYLYTRLAISVEIVTVVNGFFLVHSRACILHPSATRTRAAQSVLQTIGHDLRLSLGKGMRVKPDLRARFACESID
jgi:hypothetical protein